MLSITKKTLSVGKLLKIQLESDEICQFIVKKVINLQRHEKAFITPSECYNCDLDHQ